MGGRTADLRLGEHPDPTPKVPRCARVDKGTPEKRTNDDTSRSGVGRGAWDSFPWDKSRLVGALVGPSFLNPSHTPSARLRKYHL